MKDLIEYIVQLFGLELQSKFALLDMENDIGEIQNHADYVRYLKNSINLDDVKYLTAYQKFLTLTKRYKQLEVETLNADLIEKMGSLAERLADKVRAIDTIVLNGVGINFEWEGFKTNGEQYFTVKECTALRSIGTPITCVRLQRQVSGRDMLFERLEAIFVMRVTTPQLEAPKQDMNLIANLAKGVRV